LPKRRTQSTQISAARLSLQCMSLVFVLVVPCCSDTCDKSRRHIPYAVACLENTAISGHGTRRVPATLTSVTRVCSHWHLQFLVLQLRSGEFANSNEQSVGCPFLEPLGNPRGPVLFISQRIGLQRHLSDASDRFAKADIRHQMFQQLIFLWLDFNCPNDVVESRHHQVCRFLLRQCVVRGHSFADSDRIVVCLGIQFEQTNTGTRDQLQIGNAFRWNRRDVVSSSPTPKFSQPCQLQIELFQSPVQRKLPS